MAIQLGDIAPDFTAESTEGTIRFRSGARSSAWRDRARRSW